jgi:flagellar biogenesis protein FliO
VVRRGQVPQLNVLEVRSLGGRHALYVVGYEQERFLIASSPAGISLVSHLQSPGDAAPDKNDGVRVSFAQTLTHLLNGK